MARAPCRDGAFLKRYLPNVTDNSLLQSILTKDAHNTILDFDTDTSFFAVYDGHGGHEVATYCALNLPDFIKNLDVYKKGDLIKALEEGYLEFDKTLTREDVIKVLHVVAGMLSSVLATSLSV